MKQSGIHLTIIAVLVIALSIGLAGVLSMLTPEFASGEGPGSSQGEDIGDPVADPGTDGEAPNPPPPSPTGGLEGGNPAAVKTGRLPGYEDAPENTDPAIFSYLLNGGVELEKPDGVANILAENTPGNICPMQVCYYLEDTGELIYTSAMVQPGEYVGGDSLSVSLKKGEYAINAIISVYDADSLELKTTFHQAVTLTVNQKLFGIF